MDFYMWSIVAFVIITLIMVAFISRGDPDEDELSHSSTINELRSRQISGLREHAIKRKFEETIEERTDNKKKLELEQLLLKAGLDEWSYGEYFVTRIGLGLLGLIVSWLFLNNVVITLVMGGLLYILPGQVVTAIANRRTTLMEEDIGTFIQLTSERYKVHGNFQEAVRQSSDDFIGHEPLHSEIRKTILDFNVGKPTAEAMEDMGKRTGNKFLTQLANYYDIASTIGTESSRDKIIGQAWENYNADYKMKKTHEQEINGPKTDAYIIVGALPLLMAYQASVDPAYIDFFMNDTIGQIGLGVILIVTIACIVFINKKIAAPLD